jgi:uncharacterized protein YkwD
MAALVATPRAAGGFFMPMTDVALAQHEASLLKAVNEARLAHHLRPLVVEVHLERAARFHSQTMLDTDTITHGDFVGRMTRFRVAGRLKGENLAWGVGSYASPETMVAEWLASPHHRANLLSPRFKRIGVGCAVGKFGGYDGAMVVTTDFSGR